MTRNRLVLLVVLPLLLLLAAYLIFQNRRINDFDSCAKAGYPIQESYPERCVTPDGRAFTRKIAGKGSASSVGLVDIGMLSSGEKLTQVITSPSQWESFLSSHGKDPSDFEAIDFSATALVAVMMGAQPSSGYSLTLENVSETDGKLVLAILETSPGAGCVTAQVVTHPYLLIKLTKADKPIEYVYRQESLACN